MTTQVTTLYGYIQLTAKKNPNGISYEFMGKKTTYHEFIEQINNAALSLIELGIKEDDIICIAMPNTPQAIIMLYAANKIGAVVNMIHPLSSENEFKSFINKFHAKTILILDRFYDVLKGIENDTPLENIIIADIGETMPFIKKIGYKITQRKPSEKPAFSSKCISWHDFTKFGTADYKFTENKGDPDKMALILNSGGTTGKIKGVCLSNRQVNESALQIIRANPSHSCGDKFLSVMPLFHGEGLIIGIHAIQVAGLSCILIPRFTPEIYAKNLLEHKCNYISGVPSLFEKLINVKAMQKSDLSFLKGVFCGADFLSVEEEQHLNRFLKDHNSGVLIRQGYGMSEGVAAISLNPIDKQKEGSIGKPLDKVKMKIVNPGTEEILPNGEVGEIVFSSPTNMMYYYDEPEETSAVKKIHSDGSEWIHSGDLGYRDDEGFFFFKGRIKRMIITNGYNVFPNELESIIKGFDMVSQCCVIGVSHESGTKKIKAYIVLKDGYPKDESTKNQILDLCKKSIAKYALPKSIEFIDCMPTTKIGKIDFTALK